MFVTESCQLNKTSSIRHHTTSPKNNQEAYLLLEAAHSDRVISSLKKDLAFKMIHRNILTLQLNRITLEWVEADLNDADEHIRYVRLSIRESRCSIASEYVM
ncbi:hypothetical protein JVT61DRAFT_12222 [Boletus reticuloceps]|uniref:Uncharacterized protein n=1 Tax=Boletus reticuloceps TaxID=495285 RepID=A0A8I2YEE9_9AGAM|nr:hypothetical protein JVT61DRAFT_12222 [Boletus reticuloceps]